MKVLFWIGIAMIGYDFLGHFLCAIARLNGELGAWLWNKYSRFIWVKIPDNLTYDLYWSVFFALAMFFLIVGAN